MLHWILTINSFVALVSRHQSHRRIFLSNLSNSPRKDRNFLSKNENVAAAIGRFKWKFEP